MTEGECEIGRSTSIFDQGSRWEEEVSVSSTLTRRDAITPQQKVRDPPRAMYT